MPLYDGLFYVILSLKGPASLLASLKYRALPFQISNRPRHDAQFAAYFVDPPSRQMFSEPHTLAQQEVLLLPPVSCTGLLPPTHGTLSRWKHGAVDTQNEARNHFSNADTQRISLHSHRISPTRPRNFGALIGVVCAKRQTIDNDTHFFYPIETAHHRYPHCDFSKMEVGKAVVMGKRGRGIEDCCIW